MNEHQTWSLPWQARLKHLAENLGPGTGAGSAASAGATSGAVAVAVAGSARKGLRSRGAMGAMGSIGAIGAMGVTGSWLGRARMGGAVGRDSSSAHVTF